MTPDDTCIIVARFAGFTAAMFGDGRPVIGPTLPGLKKVFVDQALRARGWRKADLAHALNVDQRRRSIACMTCATGRRSPGSRPHP